MAYTLPELPYAYDALEPFIDAKTMEIHHSKHHAAYVQKTNAALEGHPALAAKPIEKVLADLSQIPEAIRAAVVNNGGGVLNHSLFWEMMGPGKGGKPKGALADAIASTFGDFDKFQTEFSAAAAGRFGSGWACLCVDTSRKLNLCAPANQDTVISKGHAPVLLLDVWEHAYYLKYQNRRPEYIQAWWNVVNWDKASELFEQAMS